jgi:cardiolipin synthase
MDYRSLVHHFENGVWMYDCPCLKDLKSDMERTMEKSLLMDEKSARGSLLSRIFCAVLRVFAPLM